MSSIARAASSIVLALFVASPLVVRADAIHGPSPCPPGSSGRSSHQGQWCVPHACDAATPCDGDARCTPWRVCTQGSMVMPNHRGIDPDDVPARQEMVIATCDPSAACTGTEEPPPPTIGSLVEEAPTCTTVDVCVPAALPSLTAPPAPDEAPPAPDAPSPPMATAPADTGHACGCSAVGTRREASGAIALAMLGIFVVLRVRRRS